MSLENAFYYSIPVKKVNHMDIYCANYVCKFWFVPVVSKFVTLVLKLVPLVGSQLALSYQNHMSNSFRTVLQGGNGEV